jgi:RNA polymerase sigma-70 factor, ECF subfamily
MTGPTAAPTLAPVTSALQRQPNQLSERPSVFDEPSCRPPGDSASDEHLVSQLAGGCGGALAPLHRRYAPRVFRLAARWLDRPAAEEVVQDVFLDVWRGAASFDGRRGNFRAWLFRLAHWRTVNELRRRYGRPRPAAGGADDSLEQLMDDDPEPFDVVARAERRTAVEAALRVLPPTQRQAVALAFLEERTHEEVSAVLNVPLGTTKSRIRAGLHKLRVYLGPLAATL